MSRELDEAKLAMLSPMDAPLPPGERIVELLSYRRSGVDLRASFLATLIGPASMTTIRLTTRCEWTVTSQ